MTTHLLNWATPGTANPATQLSCLDGYTGVCAKLVVKAHPDNQSNVFLCNTPTPNKATGAGIYAVIAPGESEVLSDERANGFRHTEWYIVSDTDANAKTTGAAIER